MATDLPTAIAATVPRAGTPVPALAQPGLPPGTITLGGGFSPVNGMEFLGQSEAKGSALSKCQRLFNYGAVLSSPPLALCVAHSRCIRNNLNTSLFWIDLVDKDAGILVIHANFYALHLN